MRRGRKLMGPAFDACMLASGTDSLSVGAAWSGQARGAGYPSVCQPRDGLEMFRVGLPDNGVGRGVVDTWLSSKSTATQVAARGDQEALPWQVRTRHCRSSEVAVLTVAESCCKRKAVTTEVASGTDWTLTPRVFAVSTEHWVTLASMSGTSAGADVQINGVHLTSMARHSVSAQSDCHPCWQPTEHVVDAGSLTTVRRPLKSILSLRHAPFDPIK